jgi:hypothetical protein
VSKETMSQGSFDELLLIRALPEADGRETFRRDNPHRRRRTESD